MGSKIYTCLNRVGGVKVNAGCHVTLQIKSKQSITDSFEGNSTSGIPDGFRNYGLCNFTGIKHENKTIRSSQQMESLLKDIFFSCSQLGFYFSKLKTHHTEEVITLQ